jgi:hypothetical protein
MLLESPSCNQFSQYMLNSTLQDCLSLLFVLEGSRAAAYDEGLE